ncbi:sugar transporter SWEET1 [Trichonephila inaurata madagascariensis]|uniref:Sugar transporter SWEET1 n=1 Tax=Trichonephila inaurata madagascariensis TaxID=2747483 RepID=A0A8X6Y6A9_9ARAC|nr:sugar transporter SWEET1 [Trichonephila inaurata madagascariensis]
MDLITIVANVAIVCTILSGLSGLPICLEFIQKGSTLNASILPFLAGMICTNLWLQYSIILSDNKLLTVNLITTLLQTMYVLCYSIITSQKKTALQMLGTAITFLFLTYVYGFHIIGKTAATNTIGFMAAFSSIAASAAPLASVSQVLSTKSSESLPAPIIFSTFIVTALWFIYGVLVEDSFIQIPNLIGAVLSGFQLSLIFIYPSRKVIKKE